MGRHSDAEELGNAAESGVVALARAGDAAAFAELVRRRHSHVRRFMRYLCGDATEADDLAQQVFIKVWRSIGRLESALAFGAWLRKVMLTTWLEQQRRGGLVYADSAAPAETAAASDQTAKGMDLDAALATLPPAQRLSIVLAYHEGMTHEEIAAATDTPLGTVKSQVSRGAAQLRNVLAAYRPQS